MINTGTPRHFRFRSSPEEDAVNSFTRRIVTQPVISHEEWLEGLEAFRVYIVKKIFPKITLQPLVDNPWFKSIVSQRCGDENLFQEQMFFIALETASSIKMWGLTRRGKWVLANRIQISDYTYGVSLAESSCEELIALKIQTPAEIAFYLTDFISRQIRERREKLSELEEYYSTAEFFTGIAKIKSESAS